ncbi:MAG: 4Fe-4S dicluster domain-containing protein [Synergistaceae bacterium]|jgi:NAD-dependent dihydropyrimidine dehydrogenase PreA subunit|nr:4Fe-4S dicluster domain-containing protein [Synergistaceae bacterium]
MKLTAQHLKNVSTLSLDAERCVGCGMCLTVCPRGVLEMRDGRAKVADSDSCIECGACALNCPASALSVHPGAGCAAAVISGLLFGGDGECKCC